MPVVNINGVGPMNFPDSMSQEEIANAIHNDILPKFPELAAKTKRTFGEAATDLGASLTKGVGSLAQVPGQITQLFGVTTAEDADKGLQGLGKQLEQFGEESKSTTLKGKEAVRSQKIEKADGMLAEFGTAIKETIRDPALLISFFVEQLPNLVGSWGGGLLARGSTKVLMMEATSAALGKAGVRGAVGTGAVMQGADIGSDTYETIYKGLKKQGMDDEQANGIALSKGRTAAIEALLISIAAAKLPGGTSIERAMAGKGLPTTGGIAKGLFGESVSEGVEEGGGKFVSNAGVQEALPETSLTKGIGAAAGMGALGGGLFGGVSGGINARREDRIQQAKDNAEQFKQDTLKAAEDAAAAIDQARRDAFDAEQKETEMVIMRERLGDQFTQSDAYNQLLSDVETIKAKAEQSAQNASAKQEAAIARQDELKARESAFTYVEPNAEGIMEASRPITEADFKAMNIAPSNKKLREQLLGKDLSNSEVAKEVKTTLENWVQQGRSEPINKGVGAFLDLPEFVPPPAKAKPKRRMKKLKPTAEERAAETLTAEEQASLQDELQMELSQDGQPNTEQQIAGGTTTSLSGPIEPSVRVPSIRSGTTTSTKSTERRGMVPAEDVIGQPIGAETPVTNSLETAQATGLNKRQLKEYEEAAASYSVGANNDAGKTNTAERALDYLAADLYAKENVAQAKRFERGLSQENKAYVAKKVSELKQQETRGAAAQKADEARSAAEKAFKEELGQEDGPLYKGERFGETTDALVSAVKAGNLNAALNEIANNKSDTFNILEKLVSRRLLANKGSLPKIEIVGPGVIRDGGNAQYNPFTDTVQIRDGNVDSHTVLHETVHGFLHALIQKFELEGVKNKGISDLNNLYKFIQKNHPELAKEYGMESLTEFASELMSNREFQATLAQIPYRTENQSIFTAFIRAVLNALGLSPTQKLSALASGLVAADQSLAMGRKVQQDVITGKETMPTVQVKRDDLKANYAATGAQKRAKPTVETGAFQAAKETFKNTTEAKKGFARFLNTAETMLFSSDAALNNAIRSGLESSGKSWETIKQFMYDISTAQATHADATAMQFLEKGDLEYDTKVRKWVSKESKDSWAGLVNKISTLAKQYGVSFAEMNNYAQQAFVSERLKGLSKSKQEVFSHMTPAEIEAGIKFFDMIPELRDVQKSWNGVRANAMKVAVEGGLYNEAQAKELLDIMDYVPFYRIEQLAQNAGPREYGRGLIDFAKGFKLEGSDQEVANIFDNMERWTSYTVSRAVKNRTALNLYSIAKELFPGEVTDLRIDERTKREQNTIELWVDGNRRKVEFKDPLFVHAFNGIEAAAIPQFKLASSIANFTRKNIVLMPLFSINQLYQDSFGAMLTSGLKHPWLLPLEVAKEFTKTLMGRSTAATELTKYGAVGVRDYSATMVRDTAEIMVGLKSQGKGGKFMGALETFAMASDNAVRQAVYNMTMKETGDKALAVERAFEIINFKRSGASGKIQMMRQVVPFFGAYLQAQNVVYKVATGKGIAPQQRKEALRILASNALKISALSFMYAAIASDDEDYQKMDPTIRDRHLLIPGTSVMLPMRSDLTLLPKLIGEYIYLGMTDNAFTDGKKIRRAMGDALANAVLSPTAVPQVAKPFLEVATNYNFFTGRSIVGQGIADKITSEQYTNSTSELGKFIGSSGIISPVNADHLIKGYFGTTGGLGLMVTNAIVNSAKDQPKPEKSWQDAIASTPGMSAFVAREYGNADKNDFYELRGEVSKISTTFNAMQKQGRVEDAKELLEENKDLLKVKSQVNNIGRQLSKLREYENHIYNLPEARMDAEKKGEALKRVREQEKKLLANVNQLRKMAGY